MTFDLHAFDKLRFLSSTPLFNALSTDEIQRIAPSCQIRSFAKGDMLFRAGEPCASFHIVAVGQVKLFVLSPVGQEKVIEIFSTGQSFAEAFMFLDQPYIVNAQALTDTVTVQISRDGIFREIQHDPHFSMHMLAGISRRLHTLIKDVDSYALRSGMQRLIGFLLRDVELNADSRQPSSCTVSLPASKATIASRLSLTPEYFSRVLHELEAQRLIRIDKRDIHILDLPALIRYGSH